MTEGEDNRRGSSIIKALRMVAEANGWGARELYGKGGSLLEAKEEAPETEPGRARTGTLEDFGEEWAPGSRGHSPAAAWVTRAGVPDGRIHPGEAPGSSRPARPTVSHQPRRGSPPRQARLVRTGDLQCSRPTWRA